MGLWDAAIDTISGWGDALASFASGELAQTIGDYLIPDFIVDGETNSAFNAIIGDAAMGAVAGGVTAALTGGDVWEGAAIGGALGGLGGYAVNSDMSAPATDVIGRAFDNGDGTSSPGDTETWSKILGQGKSKSGVGLLDSMSAEDKVLAGKMLEMGATGVAGYYKQKDAEEQADKKHEAEMQQIEAKHENDKELAQLKYDQKKAKYGGIVNPVLPQPKLNGVGLDQLNTPHLNQVQVAQQQPQLTQAQLDELKLAMQNNGLLA